jgi:hypothetical protein
MMDLIWYFEVSVDFEGNGEVQVGKDNFVSKGIFECQRLVDVLLSIKI